MLKYAIIPLALLGCGATNSPPSDGAGSALEPPAPSASPSASAAAALPPGVETRLGCTDITTEQIDRELAIQQRTSRAPVTRDAVRDRLIRAAVVGNYARGQAISVDAYEVDAMLERIATESRLTVEQMIAEVRASGVDEAYYRAALRDQVLELKVRMRLVPDEADPPALIEKSDVELARLREELEKSPPPSCAAP